MKLTYGYRMILAVTDSFNELACSVTLWRTPRTLQKPRVCAQREDNPLSKQKLQAQTPISKPAKKRNPINQILLFSIFTIDYDL